MINFKLNQSMNFKKNEPHPTPTKRISVKGRPDAGSVGSVKF